MLEKMYKIKTGNGVVILTTREAQQLYMDLREIFEKEVLESEMQCMCEQSTPEFTYQAREIPF
jgi:repressor of nif and glnA expression